MSGQATRVFEIPTAAQLEDGSLVVDTSELETWLARMVGVLQEVGGQLTVAADRRQVGELGSEPIALTVGVTAQWRSFSPLTPLVGEEEQPPAAAPATEPEA